MHERSGRVTLSEPECRCGSCCSKVAARACLCALEKVGGIDFFYSITTDTFLTVTYSNGNISIGQDVLPTSDVCFNSIDVSGNITANKFIGDFSGNINQVQSISNFTTDDLSQGNVNFYYANSRVANYLLDFSAFSFSEPANSYLIDWNYVNNKPTFQNLTAGTGVDISNNQIVMRSICRDNR